MKRNARHIRTGVTVILGCAAVLGTLVLPTVPPVAGAVEATPADMVIEWNANAQAAIIGTAGQGPTVAYLHLAMVQGAVYDAVNAIEGGYEPYLAAPALADPGGLLTSGCRAGGARRAVGAVPEPASHARCAARGLARDDPRRPCEGRRDRGGGGGRGRDARRADRRRTLHFVHGRRRLRPRRSGGARHPRSSSSPRRGSGTSGHSSSPTRTRCARTDRTRSPADDYAADFNEVKELGSLTSAKRTADQTDAARFWQGNGAGLFNAILRQLADTQDLDIAEAARMFAMADLAGADGAIACWNDKYYWNFWRPITAIHEADNDGNPATVADPTWTPLFATPPFPEHPSGHTCISGAVVKTLQHFFGTDKVSFSTFSSFSNSTRSFDRFSEAIKEIIDARVWAGIHFRTADAQGHVIGRKVAHELSKNYFEPVG